MKKSYTYRNRGTCSSEVSFSIEDGIVSDISFRGGCNGNLQGISRLAQGLSAEEVIKRCEGIRCGMKATSCPDQLAQALRSAMQDSSAE